MAYDWDNYRFSSIYCNRRREDKFSEDHHTGGKWCYFPLFENSLVAKSKPRLDDEDIMLLDPCDRDDPSLLTFDSTGEAIPSAFALQNDRDKKRVSASVSLYHLDHGPLKELREEVWGRCQRMINEMRNISNQPEISITDKARIKFLKDEIREMTDRDSELSAVAIACCEENGLSALTPER